MSEAVDDIACSCHLFDPFVECGRCGIGVAFASICIAWEGIGRTILFNPLSRPQRSSNKRYDSVTGGCL